MKDSEQYPDILIVDDEEQIRLAIKAILAVRNIEYVSPPAARSRSRRRSCRCRI